MNRLGILKNACKVGYAHVMNDLWTGSFSLPAPDPDNERCQAVHSIVELFDGDRSAGLYRICEEPEMEYRTENALHAYSLEHVLAFLFDDRIDGVLELGGTGVTTGQIIERLLSYQTVRRWRLGICEFSYQFQYSWESEDLLNAIYSLPKCFSEPYHWTFDTSVTPWKLNLLKGEAVPSCELRYGRNERGIRRGRDLSSLCTRLYCSGSGEGVNRTTIRDAAANQSGLPYIDSPNISRYGVIARHLIDRSVTSPDLLYEKGKAYLKELEEPRVSYTLSALDLFRKTGLDRDRMEEGRCIRVLDDGIGMSFTSTILEIRKEDVDGDPLGAEVVIANRSEDVSGTIENLSARAAITAAYAQGATNLFPLQIMDNADSAHPARMKFYVPETCSRINQVLLSYTLSPFRAFSTGAAAGGFQADVTADGGQSTRTSSTQSTGKGTSAARTVVETLTSSQPISDGQQRDFTGGSVDASGAYINDTQAASGSTGSIGEQTTGVSRNGSGAMTSTGECKREYRRGLCGCDGQQRRRPYPRRDEPQPRNAVPQPHARKHPDRAGRAEYDEQLDGDEQRRQSRAYRLAGNACARAGRAHARNEPLASAGRAQPQSGRTQTRDAAPAPVPACA